MNPNVLNPVFSRLKTPISLYSASLGIGPMSPSEPQQVTVLSTQEMDAARIGMIASIVGGSVMLIAAIFYVTTVQVDSDYSYLILGMMLGTIGLCVIAYLEVCKHELLPSPSEVLKDYLGSAAVVFGTLAALWISRFSIWFLAVENTFIAQDVGNNFWIPDWMPMVQTIGVIGTVALGAWMAQRHSLGNSVRAALVLAPISVSFSVITIWLDWSAPGLSVWVGFGHLLLLSSAIIYALHLDRAPLYLLAAGVASVFPLLFSMTSVGPEAISLLVPIIVIVGITAMDRSLDRKMIENSSGFVVGTVLIAQFWSFGSPFVFAGFTLTTAPFDLSFVLWATLLVGWFGPTYMQRTPAMPIGLALALAMLQGEAAAVAWSVAFLAFIYLATRDHARTWVITWTFIAMVASWWFSSTAGPGADLPPLFGGLEIEIMDLVHYVLFPGLVGLGIWQILSSRFPAYILGMLALAGAFTPASFGGLDLPFSVLVIGTGVLALALEIRASSDLDSINTVHFLPALSSVVLASLSAGPFLADSLPDGSKDLVTLLIAPFTGVLLYALTYSIRGKEVFNTTSEDIVISEGNPFRLSLISVYILLFFGQFLGLHNLSLHADLDASIIEALRLTLFALTVGIIALEGGILKSGTPMERLGSSLAALFLIWGASITLNELALSGALIRELILIGALIGINLRFQAKGDSSEEERSLDQAVLFILLISSFMDLSGGLWSLVVFFLVADRAIRYQHGFTQIFLLPAAFAISIIGKFGILSEHGLIWDRFDLLPYLGEFSNLLGDDLLPRWSILLLVAISALSLFHHRSITNPRNEYTPYLPYFWLVVSVAVILPDARYVPGLFTIIMAALMLRTGYLGWFWINPFVAGWSAVTTLDLIKENEWGLMNIHEESAFAMTLGLVAFAQLFAYRYGFLHRFTDIRIEAQGFNLEKGPGENLGFNLYNRALGYSTLILFAPDQVVDYLPFIRVVLTGLLGLDLYLNRLLWPLRLWIIPMVVFTGEFLYNEVNIEEEFGNPATYDQFAFLLLVIAGAYQLYCSYKQVNEFNEESSESHAGIIGTFSVILGLWWFIDFGDYNMGALNGIVMVIIFGHHLVLGFGRDDSWRRLFSLVGLPTGMLVTGFSLNNQLVQVISLFLAAMTLIAQGIMYSARGGIGMGSARSEGGIHMDSMTAFIKPDLAISKESGTEGEEEGDSDDSDESDPIEEDAPEAEDVPEAEDDFASINDVRFPLLGSSIDMEIEGAMLQRIVTAVSTAGTPGFQPLVHINGQGVLSLLWEPIPDFTQEE